MQDKQPKRFLQCKTLYSAHSVLVSTHNERSSRTNSVFCHPKALVGVCVHRNVGIVYIVNLRVRGEGAYQPNAQTVKAYPGFLCMKHV